MKNLLQLAYIGIFLLLTNLFDFLLVISISVERCESKRKHQIQQLIYKCDNKQKRSQKNDESGHSADEK